MAIDCSGSVDARRSAALAEIRRGAASSECDRRYGLAPGTTHGEVVLWWVADREAHGRKGVG